MWRYLYLSGAMVLLGLNAMADAIISIESPNPTYMGKFASSLAWIEDLTGDSNPDYLMGAPREDGGGRVYVFDGNTHEAVLSIQSPSPESQFGFSVCSAGDINSDGWSDILVGSPFEDGGNGDAGRAYIFSGIDGSLLYELLSPVPRSGGYFGHSVATLGDINWDTFPDVLIGAPGENPGGVAHVFSGQTGDLIFSIIRPNPLANALFGQSATCAGDVNDDLVPDILIGAPYEWAPSLNSGQAHVFSGSDGSHLYTLDSPTTTASGYFGWSVGRISDINSDSIDDLLIGAPLEEGTGHVHIFDGHTGTIIRTASSADPQDYGWFGVAVASICDINSDGFEEILVGAPYESSSMNAQGRAYIIDAGTGVVLKTVESADPAVLGNFGCSVAGALVPDIEGSNDWALIGAHNEHGGETKSGRGYLVSPSMTVGEYNSTGPTTIKLIGISPNPARTSIHLSLISLDDSSENVILRLHDSAGREIEALDIGNLLPDSERTLDWSVPSGLPSGIYWWTVGNSGGRSRTPMVINK